MKWNSLASRNRRATLRHQGAMVCRWSWRIGSIEPTRNLFLKAVTRVCSWRLKKQGNPSLRTGKNSTTYSHFFSKTATRICSWRLKTQGNPHLRTGKNSTTYSHILFQDSRSHLPLETEKTRKSKFENKQKQHGRLAILSSIHLFIKKSFFVSIGKSMRGFVSETFFWGTMILQTFRPPGLQKQKARDSKGVPRLHAHGVWTFLGACLGSPVVSGWARITIWTRNSQTTEVWIVIPIEISHFWTKLGTEKHLKSPNYIKRTVLEKKEDIFVEKRGTIVVSVFRIFPKLRSF